MDIEKLIEAVRLCGSTPTVDQCKQCAYWAGGDMSRCIPNMTGDAATALSALQAENEKLRAELEQARTDCAVAEKNHADCIGELEQVKRERDAAVDCIYKIEDDLDRGTDNDWAREHISEWESQKED